MKSIGESPSPWGGPMVVLNRGPVASLILVTRVVSDSRYVINASGLLELWG